MAEEQRRHRWHVPSQPQCGAAKEPNRPALSPARRIPGAALGTDTPSDSKAAKTWHQQRWTS
jgi:hypothetical protein